MEKVNIILTGEIQSGKSTFLKEFFSHSVIVKSYLRLGNYMYIFPDNKKQIYFKENDGLKVGKYHINPQIFNWIENDWKKTFLNYQGCILDEIGKLELNKKIGFYHIYKNYILGKVNNIVVVRFSLLEKFLEEFSGYRFNIFTFERKNKTVLQKEISAIIN